MNLVDVATETLMVETKKYLDELMYRATRKNSRDEIDELLKYLGSVQINESYKSDNKIFTEEWRKIWVPSDNTVEHLIDLAQKRAENKKQICPGIRKSVEDLANDYFTGLLAEYASGELFNATITAPIDYINGDNGLDVKLRSGKTINVKCRRDRGNDFLLNKNDIKDLTTDYCALYWTNTRYGENAVELIGICTKQTFIKNQESINIAKRENTPSLRLAIKYNNMDQYELTDSKNGFHLLGKKVGTII